MITCYDDMPWPNGVTIVIMIALSVVLLVVVGGVSQVRTNCGQYLLQKRLSSALHIIITTA